MTTKDDGAAAAPGPRVLVADDNEDAAGMLATLLEFMGAEVRVAHDGVEAVGEATDFAPHLVILDIGMPRLDGYATCRQLRALPWASDAHFVALTGFGQDADRARTREAGFDEHLVKPIDADDLERILAGL